MSSIDVKKLGRGRSGDRVRYGVGGSGEGRSEGVVKGDEAQLGGIDHPPATAAFDAVFTSSALHWIKKQHTVIEGAKRVLRPGGRFVGEFGGHGTLAALRVAMHAALSRRGLDPLELDPWHFPTVREYGRVLEAAGFIVDNIEVVPQSITLPAGTGMKGMLSTFFQDFLSTLPHDHSCGPSDTDENGLSSSEAAVIDEAVATLQPALCDEDGIWTADYVTLRFEAHLALDCDTDDNSNA
eukprot:jgi/Undpi1/108/HiC_scaffold_1.g00108.m1